MSLVEAGEFHVELQQDDRPAPDTQLGSVHQTLDEPRLVKAGSRIEAAVGKSFGVRLKVANAQGRGTVWLRVRVTHPEITVPQTGRRGKVDQWGFESIIGIAHYVGWRFDGDWELRPGTWRMQIVDEDGVVLLEQAFEVVLPGR